MNERIKQVRKGCGLKQAEFAERIGVKAGTVTSYETGLRVPSDAVIFSICREFGVSETWLRTGDGEMFLPVNADEELAQVLAETQRSDDPLIKSIIKSYWSMDDAGKSVIRQLVADLAEAVQEDKASEAAEKAPGN